MTLLDRRVRELRETAVSVDEDAMRVNDYGSILSTLDPALTTEAFESWFMDS